MIVKRSDSPLTYVYLLIVGITAGYVATKLTTGLGTLQVLSFAVAVIYAAVLVVLVYLAYRDAPRDYLFHPFMVLLVSFGVGYLGRSLYALVNANVLSGFEGSEGYRYLWRALLVVLLGTAAIIVGYAIPAGGYLAHRAPRISETIRENRLLAVIILFFVGGSLAFLLWLQLAGGLTLSLDEFAFGKRRTSYEFLRTGYRFIYLSAILGYIYYVKVRKTRLWFVLLGVSLIIPFLISSRKDLALILLTILVIRHFHSKRLKLGRTALQGLVLLGLSMIVLSQRNQRQFDTQRLITYLKPETVLAENLGNHSYADIVTVAHLVRYIENGGELLAGRIITDSVTRFIPRAIWPDKPKNIGIVLSALFYNKALGRQGEFFGIPPSLIAELYWNFHLPGVMLGALLFGIFIRFCFAYHQRLSFNIWVTALYGLELVYVFEQSKSSFPQLIQRHVTIFIPFLLAMWWISRPGKRVESESM